MNIVFAYFWKKDIKKKNFILLTVKLDSSAFKILHDVESFFVDLKSCFVRKYVDISKMCFFQMRVIII